LLCRLEVVVSAALNPSPHIGAATLDVIRETGRFLLDQLADALAGNPPRNVVSA
jgi:lactate dehydrogenase-like 2-hydroxyacid dehydrogenase